MRQRPRTDGNHAEIVQALRTAGCTVQSLAALGHGAPDLLIGFRAQNYLVEVKDGSKPPSKRRLTPDELTWHTLWRGQVAIAGSVAEALAVIYSTHDGA